VEDVMIEFVERPRPPALTDERRALLETAKNGKAIVVELNVRPSRRVQNTFRAWLRTQGYLLHYKRSPDASYELSDFSREACDARCQAAVLDECNCPCYGKNHGQAHRKAG
jgi:hypothetical protein